MNPEAVVLALILRSEIILANTSTEPTTEVPRRCGLVMWIKYGHKSSLVDSRASQSLFVYFMGIANRIVNYAEQ
jgi:hypothetical protein